MKLIKELLSENLKIEQLAVQDAIACLNANCKDALWMLEENAPFYRGWTEAGEITKNTGFAISDPTLTVRKSKHTYNFYTLFLDNIDSMKQYPKRSKSFIATTDYSTSRDYAGDHDSLILVPFDGVKIGVVNSIDIWEKNVKFFDKLCRIVFVNKVFKQLGLSEYSWEEFKSSAQKMLESQQDRNVFCDALSYTWPDDEIVKNKIKNIEKTINDAYSPMKMGFDLITTKSHRRFDTESEVWIGGKCVIITRDMWNKLRKDKLRKAYHATV